MGIKQKNREDVSAKLSKNLRAVRIALNMTQAQVAEAIYTSYEFYSRCERAVSLPSVPMLVTMANALHVSIDELLETMPAPKLDATESDDSPSTGDLGETLDGLGDPDDPSEAPDGDHSLDD